MSVVNEVGAFHYAYLLWSGG